MTKIYIKNLAKTITEAEIKKYLSPVGIKSVSIFRTDRFYNPEIFALVEIDAREDVEKLIEKLKGKELNNNKVSIIEAKPIEIPEK